MQRLRITFAKSAAMRFSGHLDLHKTWERWLRRADLPVAYSEGFNPRPKLQLAAALPLGFTSECEVADVWMEAPQDPAAARNALQRAAAPGLSVLDMVEVPERAPSLQTQVLSAEYRVAVASDLAPDDMDRRISAVMASSEIRRERRGKPYDLRPLIERLERTDSDELGHTLTMRLAAREGATGRPEEVVEALEHASAEARYHRLALVLAEAAPT